MFNRNDDLLLCEKYKIKPNQLSLIKLYIEDPEIESEKSSKAEFMKNIHRFGKLFGIDLTKEPRAADKKKEYNTRLQNFLKENLHELIQKNILIAPPQIKGKPTALDLFEINPEFMTDFELDLYGMPDELFDTYPNFIEIKGKKAPAKNTTVEVFGIDYLKKINNCPQKHKEILELVTWAKENKCIMFGLEKFVQLRNWEALKELKEEGGGNVGFSVELG